MLTELVRGMHCRWGGVRWETTCKYHSFNDLSQVAKEDPLAVFEADTREMVQEMKMVFFLAEYETAGIAKGHFRFVNAYKKMEKVPKMQVLRGENHVHSIYGIGGEGDKRGKAIGAVDSVSNARELRKVVILKEGGGTQRRTVRKVTASAPKKDFTSQWTKILQSGLNHIH